MENVDSQRVLQAVADIIHRSTSFERPFQDQSPRDWRQFSERMAWLAGALRYIRRLTKSGDLATAHVVVLNLMDAKRGLYPLLVEHGVIFAAVGPASDVVCIGRSTYASAHHAAFIEANEFIREFLTIRMFHRRSTRGTVDDSFNVEELDHARDFILIRLSEAWEEDFRVVPARIQRERAAVARAASQQASQDTIQSLIGAAKQRSTSIESANEQTGPYAIDGLLPSNRLKKSKPKEKARKVIQLIDKGHSNNQIAELLNMPTGHVRNVRSQYKHDRYELCES